MILNHGISSKPILLRNKLKHSWLDNQVLNKTTDDVVFLWQNSGWSALETDFSLQVTKTLELADTLEECFSPAQLVDQLQPFETFDDQTKKMIKEAVHAAYLESSSISSLKMPLRAAANLLGHAIDELKETWKKPLNKENEVELRADWDNLFRKAKALQAVFELLPKGIVLS